MNEKEFWQAERCVIPFASDPAIVELEDGRYRMFYNMCFLKRGEVIERDGSLGGRLGAIGSSISTDGLYWTIEPGIRIEGGGLPAVTRTTDGRWRMYFNKGEYTSAVSEDGLNWVEEGIRLNLKQQTRDEVKLGVMGYVNLCVLRLKDGSFKFYWLAVTNKMVPDKYSFVISPPPPGKFNETYIMSASSEDGLKLTKDPNIRISYFENDFLGSLDSPWAIQLNDGTIRLYFSARGGIASGVFQADSRDGLEFKVNHEPVLTNILPLPYGGGAQPGDSCGPIKTSDGKWRIYYAKFLGTYFNCVCSAFSENLNPPLSGKKKYSC